MQGNAARKLNIQGRNPFFTPEVQRHAVKALVVTERKSCGSRQPRTTDSRHWVLEPSHEFHDGFAIPQQPHRKLTVIHS